MSLIAWSPEESVPVWVVKVSVSGAVFDGRVVPMPSLEFGVCASGV